MKHKIIKPLRISDKLTLTVNSFVTVLRMGDKVVLQDPHGYFSVNEAVVAEYMQPLLKREHYSRPTHLTAAALKQRWSK